MVAIEKFWELPARENLARIRRAVGVAWRPRERRPPSEWAAATLRLSPEVEAGSGPFDISGRPWWGEILDAVADPEVEELNLPAATQVGKTLALVAVVLWCAVHDPAPAMAVTPDRTSAIELRDRIYANALESPELRHLVPPQSRWNDRWIDLRTMRVYLAWSGSRQRLRGRRCKRIFLTECSAYRGDRQTGDPIRAAGERVKGFYRHFQYRESSPVEAPDPICELEEAADDRRRWHARCPHCGTWQEIRFFLHRSGRLAGRGGFGGLQTEAGDYVTPEHALQKAHYICRDGCRIDEDQRLAFIRKGRWVAPGQRVDKRGRLTGDPPASSRRRGRHLWSIHSETLTFGKIAAAYIEHRAEGKLAEFFGNWLGRSYQPATRVPSWQELGQRLAAGHLRREVPSDCWFLTAGGDVQEDRVKLVVRGWAPGCTSYLVDWIELERGGGDENQLVKSDLDQIERAVLTRKYPVVGAPGKNPLGKRELAVRMLGLDAGYRTLDCHHWFRALPDAWTDSATGRVRLLRGDAKVDPAERWKKSDITENRDGTVKYEGTLELWRVYVYLFYQDLFERRAGQAGQTGSWYVTADALSTGQQYLREVVNFHKVVEFRRGRRRPAWQPVHDGIANDFFDAEIYALVCAHMVTGDLGFSAASWREWWQQKQDRPRRRPARRRNEGPGIADR